ncbi:LEA type 2 family protein [candidate division WOR-3 bacterium]|nr:LEA type 2 family protein [candidate division WOR-3 bacterium]
MKNYYIIFLIILLVSCSFIKERVAIKECKFSLTDVTPYDFSFNDLKIDFTIKGQNPNKVDAKLDKLSYTFLINSKQLFSGTTGKGITIPSGKSTDFKTTISLDYNKVGDALVSAIKLGNVTYTVQATAYINTVLGEISYPVEISFQ